MSQVITKRTRLSRRIFLKGLTAAHMPVIVGVPPLISMFNSTGTAYAADAPPRTRDANTIDKRFVIWFNGNGIPERYWIPSTTGTYYDITPCLTPIGRLKDDVLVLSGLDNTYGGNGHPQSLCALMTCTRLSSSGPGALPPEEIPHRLFDRLFGARDLGWVNRKRSILDALARDGAMLRKGLPKEDEMRLDEHLSSIRDLERAITTLPPEYRKVTPPDEDFDMKDWP